MQKALIVLGYVYPIISLAIVILGSMQCINAVCWGSH